MPTIGVDARSVLCREPRGEGKTLLRLYEEILRQRPDLKVWFFGDSTASAFTGKLPQGIHVDASASWGHRIDGWENVSLPWRAWRRGCDVLHCASSGAPAWSPVPTVMTVHDMIPALRIDGQSEVESHHFLRRLRRGLKRARHVIAVSEHTRQDLLGYFPQTKSRVTVVHWGCDPAPLLTAGTEPDGKYVLAFGGSAPRKNTAYAIDRFAKVLQSAPGLRLVIAGISNGDKRRTLLMQAERLQVSSSVDIPGYVSERELDQLLRRATVMLFPSTYEGFGVPVLDAIARGVPVIAANRSSLPEILDGVPGCMDLERPAEMELTITKLVQSDALRSSWISEQVTVLKKFQWTKSASLTLALLLSACPSYHQNKSSNAE